MNRWITFLAVPRVVIYWIVARSGSRVFINKYSAVNDRHVISPSSSDGLWHSTYLQVNEKDASRICNGSETWDIVFSLIRESHIFSVHPELHSPLLP